MLVYKFYKDNCGPCYLLQRTLSMIDIPEHIKIVPLNVGEEENKVKAREHDITAVPALLTEDGRILKGKITKELLLEFLNP